MNIILSPFGVEQILSQSYLKIIPNNQSKWSIETGNTGKVIKYAFSINNYL